MLLETAGFPFIKVAGSLCVNVYHIYPFVHWQVIAVILSLMSNVAYEHEDADDLFEMAVSFPLDVYPEVGSWSASTIFSFPRSLHAVFCVAALVYIPTNSACGSPFSTPSPAASWWEVWCSLGLRWLSQMTSDVEHLFTYLLVIWLSLEKVSI